MSGLFSDRGLTVALAILIGSFLLLVAFSGRFSPRVRNGISGLGLCAAMAAFAWGVWSAVAGRDWLHVAFFAIVIGMVAWRTIGVYRQRSARAERQAKMRSAP